MAGVNRAIILGRLGRDPEVRYTQSNKPVANLSVATSRSWKDNSGEWQEKTAWHRITAWDHLAEKAEKWSKGDQVYIEGEIEYREYEQDGQKKYSTEINARFMMLCGNKGEGKPAGVGDSGHFEPPAAATVAADPDDLPF